MLSPSPRAFAFFSFLIGNMSWTHNLKFAMVSNWAPFTVPQALVTKLEILILKYSAEGRNLKCMAFCPDLVLIPAITIFSYFKRCFCCSSLLNFAWSLIFCHAHYSLSLNKSNVFRKSLKNSSGVVGNGSVKIVNCHDISGAQYMRNSINDFSASFLFQPNQLIYIYPLGTT